MTPTSFATAGPETEAASKDRLIDALHAQLREAREELSDVRAQLMKVDARLAESRYALDRCMGMRS